MGLGSAGEGQAEKLAEMMKSLGNLQDNPMLKGLAEANPEMAEMLNNPELMAEQMKKVGELLTSEEGQGMMGKMMQEMQSVLTDPDKLQQGLEQLTTNPALKGVADALPGLREVLDDPVAMREQVEKTAELFQNMGDPEKMQEMMAQLGGGEGLAGMQEGMAKMMESLMGGEGADGEGLASLLGGLGGDGEDGAPDLKQRVNDLAARLLQSQQRGGEVDPMAEVAPEIDEEF